MTTNELTERVVQHYRRWLPGTSSARTVVLGITNIIAEELANGNDVRLENLGTLAVQTRKQRAVLFGKPNPNAGQETRQVTFRDGAALRRLMNPELK